jgi:hypothetical protein
VIEKSLTHLGLQAPQVRQFRAHVGITGRSETGRLPATIAFKLGAR